MLVPETEQQLRAGLPRSRSQTFLDATPSRSCQTLDTHGVDVNTASVRMIFGAPSQMWYCLAQLVPHQGDAELEQTLQVPDDLVVNVPSMMRAAP